jgi:hypothetical protein
MFHYRLSASRIAFGLPEGRFRRLRKFDNISKQLCKEMIMAACTLHNICIDANDVIESTSACAVVSQFKYPVC